MARSNNGEPFYRLELPETTMLSWQSGTRGAVEDMNGMVYFATPLGIQVAMQNGRVDGDPESADSGRRAADSDHLRRHRRYKLALRRQNGKLYRRPVKVTGANAWTVVKPPKPTL